MKLVEKNEEYSIYYNLGKYYKQKEGTSTFTEVEKIEKVTCHWVDIDSEESKFYKEYKRICYKAAQKASNREVNETTRDEIVEDWFYNRYLELKPKKLLENLQEAEEKDNEEIIQQLKQLLDSKI